MKINRFVALAAIALILVGALSVISYKVFAQSSAVPASQSQDCTQDKAGDTEEQSVAENDNIQEQCGDQNAPDKQETDGKQDTEAAPSGTPAITAEQAQTAALAVHSGTVHEVELDEENGKLVYGVEFDGGVDVKVDAMTGAILGTETGQD